MVGLDDPRDLSQIEGFCDLLAAFTSSPQDQSCSSLLTKTSSRELCAGYKHLSAELPSPLAFWCFFELVSCSTASEVIILLRRWSECAVWAVKAPGDRAQLS